MKGIYKITNKINNKSYIGYSNNIERRWQEHMTRYNCQQEYNKVLYKAIRKYGLSNFSFEVIEETENLQEREKYWIKYYDTFNHGYNETLGGDGHITSGETNNMAILTEKEVIFIREKYVTGESKIEVYRKYFQNRISFSGFEAVWQGKTWKNIMPEIYTKEEKEKHIHRSLAGRVNVGEKNKRSKLTNEQVFDIINMLEKSNKSQKEIAEDFNVSYNTVNLINRCKIWRHLHNYKNNIRQEYREGVR